MNVEECYYLGYTSKVHCKEGEIIIKLDVDNPEEYNGLESVLIQMNKKDKLLIPFFITHTQVQNNGTLRIKIEDVNTTEEAKSLIGKETYLPLAALPKLSGKQFYYHEVIGYTVIDTQHDELGTIKQILDYPSQAIFEVVNKQNKEILIPITDDILIDIDRKNKSISVTTPEGLVELYIE